MKNLLFFISLFVFLSSCSDQKNIQGIWNSEIDVEKLIADENDEAVKNIMLGIISQANYKYIFDENGTGQRIVEMGQMKTKSDLTWNWSNDTLCVEYEIFDKISYDSLILDNDELLDVKEESFRLIKN